MNLPVSFPVADRLKAAHLAAFTAARTQHAEELRRLYGDYASQSAETEKTLYNAGFLRCFAEKFPVTIYPEESIVGTNWHWRGAAEAPNAPMNLGHFIADFETVLRLGVEGLTARAEAVEAKNETLAVNQTAYRTVLAAFSAYLRRYAAEAERLSAAAETAAEQERLAIVARNCAHLATKPPVTFWQALQLTWFVQIFLETEAGNAAVSFGRIDQYLYPYYAADLAAGRLTQEGAFSLILCFYIKTGEGDESQMITLGGVDAQGQNAENDLSLLFIRAQTYLNLRQPSIGVRIHETTGEAFWQAARELTATGNGMPAYFNDDVVIKSLKNSGVDACSAMNYGIVGCYEAAPQGSFSNTVAGQLFLYESLRLFLERTADFADYTAFFEGYKAFFAAYYAEEVLPRLQQSWQWICSLRSPFLACCTAGDPHKSGYLPEQYGCRYTLFGLNLLGIGVLIDSLYTVKKLVFERGEITLSALCEQARANFSDPALFARIGGLEGTYGSNTEESNRLTEELTVFIAEVIRQNPIGEGVTTMGSLFWFSEDIWQRNYPATLNGRRQGQLLSYGVAPCSAPHTHPVTSTLLSAAHVAAEQFPNGCPLMLALPRQDVVQSDHLRSLIKTYFAAGGYHLAINAEDAAVLEQARKHPEEHRHVMVKISGFSARFVEQPEAIQIAVLERAKTKI